MHHSTTDKTGSNTYLYYKDDLTAYVSEQPASEERRYKEVLGLRWSRKGWEPHLPFLWVYLAA